MSAYYLSTRAVPPSYRRQSRGPASSSGTALKRAGGTDMSAENMTKVLAGMIEVGVW